MKRIISALLSLLIFTSCSVKSGKNITIQPQTASIISFELNSLEYSAKLNIAPNGEMTVTFNYPDEIYGLEIKINSDGCDIKFGDLKYFYSSGEIDLCFTDLFSAFSKLKTEKPESIIQNEDIITAHYGEYIITYNKTKKLITQIQSEKYKWNFT